MRHRHSPPGCPQANSIAERKVGVALAGIRAYLATAGLPCCFWGYAGHCFAYNDTWQDHDGQGRRKDGAPRPRALKLQNQAPYHKLYVTGQLVFFKPAPTIRNQAKVEQRLAAGVFLDYYCEALGLRPDRHLLMLSKFQIVNYLRYLYF